MDISALLRKIKHFFSLIPFWRLFARQSSKCGRTTRNKAGNSLRRQKIPFGSHPDDRRSPEDLRQDALAMAKEWQAELQKWMETLKRHAT